jgi:OmpA-OmpF porin, OOP family
MRNCLIPVSSWSTNASARGLLPALCVSVALVTLANRASADDSVDPANGAGFDSHLFRPAIDSKGFFSTNGTTVLTQGSFSVGLVVDYGNVLLRVPSRGQDKPQLLDHSFQGTLALNYGIANLAVVGLSLPVNLMSGSDQVTPQAPAQSLLPGQWSATGARSQTLGFIGLHGKLRLLRVEKGFGLALGAQVGIPVTDAPKSGGADPGVFFWPQIIGERRFGTSDWLKIGLNAGFRGHVVSDTQLDLDRGRFRDGNRLTYGLGIAARIAEPLDLVVDTYGTYLLSDSAAALKPSNEVTGGIKLFFEKNSYLMIGGGPRYTSGFEAADWRGFLGFIYEPSIGDKDGDGIFDDVDQCIDVKEDFDGFEDEDGCPELDNDKDGIPDRRDACPNVPEDFDGDADEDGCPEPTDRDRDHDGVIDRLDRCPDVPGPKSNQGCPVEEDGDRDHDMIPDKIDKCPDVPENYNGIQDDDGCPDKDLVGVGDGEITVLKKIKFATNSAEILAESNEVVDGVAKIMKDHPEFLLIEIAGHADERAPDDYNLSLTQRRVDSVLRALVARGTERTRLRSKGYGEYCPESDEHTEAAWETNRRVEFKIVKTKDGEHVAARLGCANADSKGVRPDRVP